MSPYDLPEPEALADFLRDLVAVYAKHGLFLEAAWLIDGDNPVPMVKVYRAHPSIGALVLHHDGEICPDAALRYPDDVLAQAQWPDTAHQRMVAAARVAALHREAGHG